MLPYIKNTETRKFIDELNTAQYFDEDVIGALLHALNDALKASHGLEWKFTALRDHHRDDHHGEE